MAAEDASIVVVESDRCAGPLFEQPLLAVCSCRGDPNNVDVAAATAAGVPVLRAPGRNADAVAELAVALLFAATRGVVAADADVRRGEIYKDGTIPYQRFRAWELAGRAVGPGRPGRRGPGPRWRLRGLGIEVIAYDPYADEPTVPLEELLEPSRRDLPARTGHPGDRRHDRAEQFAAMRDGVVFLNSARAAAARHRRPGGRPGVGQGVGRRPRPLRRRVPGRRPPADPPSTSVVLTPHIGGATYDTESNHTAIIAEDLCRLLAGARPLHIVNPEVLDRR